jgi:hypothetical protein
MAKDGGRKGRTRTSGGRKTEKERKRKGKRGRKRREGGRERGRRGIL